MVSGTCDPAFRPVWDASAANLEEGELGAACSITVDGRVVVDVWGGWTDSGAATRDTMVNAYSVGKPVIALRLLQLIERGPIDLDDRADRWWPELLAGQRARPSVISCATAPASPIREPLTDGAVGLGRMRAAVATDP